jgi:ribosome-associated translation inhibitor RaiA
MSPEIRFLGMAPSAAVEAVARKWVHRLEIVYDRILTAEVVVDQPHRHNRQGNSFHVRIEIAVPDRVISVNRDAGDEDVYVAIANAFHAARRQLQDHARIRRGDTKRHDMMA